MFLIQHLRCSRTPYVDVGIDGRNVGHSLDASSISTSQEDFEHRIVGRHGTYLVTELWVIAITIASPLIIKFILCNLRLSIFVEHFLSFGTVKSTLRPSGAAFKSVKRSKIDP